MHPDTMHRLQRSRALVMGAMLGLITLGLAWELWLAPTGSRALALKVVPIAFAISGVSRMRLNTYRALSLLVWLYVAEGAMRATTETGLSAGLAWAELALCALLFTGCVLHVRARAAAAPAAAS